MKKIGLILLVLFCGCTAANKDQIKVKVSAKNEISIQGVPAEALEHIAGDTSGRVWQNLLPVYRLPADEDLIDDQPEQPGRYKIVKDEVQFVPDTAFVKGQKYFVRYYHYAEGGSLWDIVSKKNKPGSHPYHDIPFKL
ncbi:hypothetical protein LT679_07715 [Mucilaginibacter roseus]|uniref:DUF4861 domain-containing protein n=1 Tax=Mucilaginibacter roseus TaxID=1528868 RepID=A0ABS8U058_9SPHI|nr:hypothetical protein [Mucilaginibacter roseus]MCD8740485.1 hypothetical protein [Mucilaginibacter roseus]